MPGADDHIDEVKWLAANRSKLSKAFLEQINLPKPRMSLSQPVCGGYDPKRGGWSTQQPAAQEFKDTVIPRIKFALSQSNPIIGGVLKDGDETEKKFVSVPMFNVEVSGFGFCFFAFGLSRGCWKLTFGRHPDCKCWMKKC